MTQEILPLGVIVSASYKKVSPYEQPLGEGSGFWESIWDLCRSRRVVSHVRRIDGVRGLLCNGYGSRICYLWFCVNSGWWCEMMVAHARHPKWSLVHRSWSKGMRKENYKREERKALQRLEADACSLSLHSAQLARTFEVWHNSGIDVVDRKWGDWDTNKSSADTSSTSTLQEHF